MINFIPPGLVLIIAGFLLPLVPKQLFRIIAFLAPIITIFIVLQIPDGVLIQRTFLDYSIEIVEGDRLSRLFALIFSIMALGGTIFAINNIKTKELGFAFIYAGSAIGVTFSGDLISMFVFWEIMAIGSTMVIWNGLELTSHKAGLRYALVHFFGGVILMIGIIGNINQTGSTNFDIVTLNSWAQWLMLIGILINAGAWPISSWIGDAYPEASASGMVFLSAFTTKTAVFVLIKTFPGTDILIYIGLIMIFYGIIYALLENDMRRILAYSIVNQVGFMVTGIGIGTEMAINGAAAHAFAHIIYKALLLMSAGSVLYMTGKRKCTDLGGLYRTMPITTICGIIGALAISSFPLTSGFISKSMISQSAADLHLTYVWFLLTAASAGVFLHAGIKFPWFVFFQKDSGLRPKDPPFNMKISMILFAGLCIIIGIFPSILYSLLPFKVDYVPYTSGHVTAYLQLLLFAGLAFFILLPQMKRTLTISLDTDWIYRIAGYKIIQFLSKELKLLIDGIKGGTPEQINSFIEYIVKYHGPAGILARTLPTGRTIFWVIIIFALFLLLTLLS
ncbi:MAG: Na(+)/H(+) antiporter subunit D [Alphaproteobacteria bacterium MarineAlpha2_Bin1]|nr:MAG: Na(+)/H(+) antiporter subunit D [Alphaproteobacteria bacterium MarineAlpha2_Bin1]|tara:strand:+ start:523 stop:2208 length:1686 start_codon:yes stop_codon:yes gene_type:complete